MAKILLGYELGTGYGHAAQFAPLALELRARGHEVEFAVNDVTRAEAVLGPHGFRVFQAPLWLLKVGGLPPAANYTDIMMHCGFLDPVGLRALTRAWRNLLELVRPALLVLDHSPAALFATRGLGLPRARFGTGFTCPPLATPMPQFAWWSTVRAPHLERGEAEVAGIAKRVCAELGLPPVHNVAEMLTTDEDFLCAFPETDHYPGRDGAGHTGPIIEAADGAHGSWPAGRGARVFGYVRSEYPYVRELARGLEAAGCRAILHVPGFAQAAAASLGTPRVEFSPLPLRMADMSRECDLAVCHGGSGTVSAMLLAGKPLLLLPTQSEQYMMARRLESLGVARVVPWASDAPQFGPLLRAMLAETRYAAAANAFAAAHAGYSVRETVRVIADRCERLLGAFG